MMNQTVIAEETFRSGVSPANKGVFSSRFHSVYERLMAESPSLLYPESLVPAPNHES